MNTMQLSPDGITYRHRATVPSGQSEVVGLPVLRETDMSIRRMHTVQVWAQPTSGGSALVEATISDPSAVDAGTAVWEPWPAGDANAYASATMRPLPTAMRCTATGGDVEWEVVV